MRTERIRFSLHRDVPLIAIDVLVNEKGPFKFVLAASGHIAGVVIPPGGKYGHWENDKNPPTADKWLFTATQQPGSWWPLWDKWVSRYSGGEVAARQPGAGKLPVIEDAPGSYAAIRS